MFSFNLLDSSCFRYDIKNSLETATFRELQTKDWFYHGMLQNIIVAVSGKVQISFLIAENLQNIENSLYEWVSNFLTAAHTKTFIFTHVPV